MEKSIILLLIFSLVLAITSFYLGFINPSKKLGLAAKSFFVLIVLILIPLFAGILWFQNTAKERLAENNIVPYPGMGETVGIAFGTGESPFWLFKAGSGTISIGSFYTNEDNRPGWQLSESNENRAVLINETDKITIESITENNKGSIMYLMEKIPAQK